MWDDDWDIRRRDYKQLYVRINGKGTAHNEDVVDEWNMAKQEQALINFAGVDDEFFTEKILPISEYAQAWELTKSQKHLKVILETS